jgi:hypothetical protein
MPWLNMRKSITGAKTVVWFPLMKCFVFIMVAHSITFRVYMMYNEVMDGGNHPSIRGGNLFIFYISFDIEGLRSANSIQCMT